MSQTQPAVPAVTPAVTGVATGGPPAGATGGLRKAPVAAAGPGPRTTRNTDGAYRLPRRPPIPHRFEKLLHAQDEGPPPRPPDPRLIGTIAALHAREVAARQNAEETQMDSSPPTPAETENDPLIDKLRGELERVRERMAARIAVQRRDWALAERIENKLADLQSGSTDRRTNLV